MTKALAATLIMAGVVLLAWAGMMWWKKHREEKAHSRWVTFLMCVAGVCMGIGIGYLAGIDIVKMRVGYCPLWIPAVLIVGFGFILEAKGWKDHHVRTPLLGFGTAMVLFLAVGNSVVTGVGHEIHTVQTTSNVLPAGPKGKG
jgi:hypothetical protein